MSPPARRGTSRERSKAIARLETHDRPYVTVAELAAYWGVSPKQIYKQIEAGTLQAIRLGPRLLRLRTSEARRFERAAKISARPSETRERPQKHRTS
jgi:excisionase family DNA binding protein